MLPRPVKLTRVARTTLTCDTGLGDNCCAAGQLIVRPAAQQIVLFARDVVVGVDDDAYTDDKASNPSTIAAPRGHTISLQYDATNRLTRRIVPQVSYSSVGCGSFYTVGCSFSFPRYDGSSVCIDADTSRFTYDAEGNMRTAYNSYARVKRSYYRNGLLETDSLRIRTYRSPAPTGCLGTVASDAPTPGSEFNQHVYGLRYRYNQAGQRTALRQPDGLDTCAGLCDSTRYNYSTTRGILSSVVDWKGNTTSFAYDNAGRLTTTTFPGAWLDEKTYDHDSRINWRRVSKTAVGATVDDDLAYDAMGRVKRADVAIQNGILSPRQVNFWYSRLGSVLASDGNTTNGSAEEFRVDALGNRRYRKQENMKDAGHPDQNGVRDFLYDAAGRVTSIEAPFHPQYFYEQVYDYDASGNGKLTYSQETDYYASGSLFDASMQYYGADQKLRVFDRHINLGSGSDDARPGQRGVFEEHRYDALGRRILTRSRRHTTCSVLDAECASYVQRTVWDGDQILWEIRAKGGNTLTATSFESDITTGTVSDGYAYGRVSYTHALGIDEPIGVIRSYMSGLTDGTLLVPHLNWRGLYEGGNVASGSQQSTCAGASNCPIVSWPGSEVSIDGARPDPQAASSWMGSLIAQGRDGSGLDYRRNRYYNPETGQFTQADPIGLKGGSNLYGFAEGDPINFSDPFGLCPIELDGIPCTVTLGVNGLVAGSIAGAAWGGAGGTLALPGGGSVAGTAGGFVVGAGVGVLGGMVIGGAADLGSVLEMGMSWVDRLRIRIKIALGAATTKGKLQQHIIDRERAKQEQTQDSKQKEKERDKEKGNDPPTD